MELGGHTTDSRGIQVSLTCHDAVVAMPPPTATQVARIIRPVDVARISKLTSEPESCLTQETRRGGGTNERGKEVME
jgi:hypothetical protein